MFSRQKRILIPVDLEEVPDLAWAAATELVGHQQVVHILSVMALVEATNARFNWGTIDGESRQDYARRGLAKRLESTPFARGTCHVTFGDPAEQIALLWTQLETEIIVLPCRNQRGRLARMLKGSVAESLLRLSPCPVLVIPIDPEANRAARNLVPETPEPAPPIGSA